MTGVQGSICDSCARYCWSQSKSPQARYLNCCDCVNCTTEFSFVWTKRQSTCFILLNLSSRMGTRISRSFAACSTNAVFERSIFNKYRIPIMDNVVIVDSLRKYGIKSVMTTSRKSTTFYDRSKWNQFSGVSPATGNNEFKINKFVAHMFWSYVGYQEYMKFHDTLVENELKTI